MNRSLLRMAAAGFALFLVAAVPASVQADVVTPVRWKLAVDLRTRPDRNPFPNYTGGPSVWSLRAGRSLARDGDYPLLPHYSPTFGAAGLAARHGNTKSCMKAPAIGSNVTNDRIPLCSGHVPAKAAFVRPTAFRTAVVAWTSFFDGTVTISHNSIGDLDAACGDGISYFVDLGTASLASTTLKNGGAATLAPVTQMIHKGQSLYFIVDPGPNRNPGCDTTQLQITVDRTG